MFVAWTTTLSRSDAEHLAQGAIELNLAFCAQIDGPIKSYYRSDGILTEAEEFRICFKCLSGNTSPLSNWVHAHHPYDIPQWIVVAAENVGEKYLSWAKTNSTSPTSQSQKSP